MIFVDLLSTLILAYLIVKALGIVPSWGEKLALSVLVALIVKSFTMFVLIFVGIQPKILYQMIISLAALFLMLKFFGKRLRSISEPPQVEVAQQSGVEFKILWVVAGLLACLSFANVFYFPVTEPDGIWYHIRGMVFFREADFTSEVITAQYREYPPFVPLLYSYLLSAGWEKVKIIFPIFYICLLVVFYHRILVLGKSRRLAAVFALVLATTPYVWWHSMHSILNLATGCYFSIGAFYWLALVGDSPNQNNRGASHALLSGMFFGIAAWTRPEFVVYCAAPLAILIYVLDQSAEINRADKNKLIASFAAPMLTPLSLWYMVLALSGSNVDKSTLGTVAVCLFLWLFAGAGLLGMTKIDKKFLKPGAVVLMVLVLTAIFLASSGKVSPLSAIFLGSYETFAFHIFYSFTFLMVIFVFMMKPDSNVEGLKSLAAFLVCYFLIHWAVYCYLPPKWGTFGEYIQATFIRPGNSVNWSGTRDWLAFYPILVFYISCLPKIRRAFADE